MKTKRLITESIIRLVKSVCDENLNLSKYEFDHYNKFKIGSFYITMFKSQEPILNIVSECTQDYLKTWKQDVGQIMMRELKKSDPELYEIKSKQFRALIKRIRDDELESFQENGFDHLQIGDAHYTIIKAVRKQDLYSKTTDDYEADDEEPEPVKKKNNDDVEPIDEEVISANSFALF